MNLELSDEQRLIRESAAGLLGRTERLSLARAALDGSARPDDWEISQAAGWTDLLPVDGSHGTGPFEAMLVLEECGAALASPGLVGHLPARALLAGLQGELPASARRGRCVAVFPPLGGTSARGEYRVDATSGDEIGVEVDGAVDWVIDGPAAEQFLIVTDVRATPQVFVVDANAPGLTVRDVTRYDPTRPMARLELERVRAQRLMVDATAVGRARYLQHALLAADALGTAREALRMASTYAGERTTFGRTIGSYQGVKHRLVEMLRLSDAARSLLYRTAWADDAGTSTDFAVSAMAARVAGDRACAYATDQNLYVHGGIGATWEHDGHLLYRRAHVSRRLLGGDAAAARHVAILMLATAADQSTPHGASRGSA